MNEYNEKIPDPKELEKELGDFLAKKFGGSVKLATPIVLPQAAESDSGEPPPKKGKTIQFDLKPQDLIAYLDQYVVKQSQPKIFWPRKSAPTLTGSNMYKAHPATSATWSASLKTTC
jgi:hypothetical protein